MSQSRRAPWLSTLSQDTRSAKITSLLHKRNPSSRPSLRGWQGSDLALLKKTTLKGTHRTQQHRDAHSHRSGPPLLLIWIPHSRERKRSPRELGGPTGRSLGHRTPVPVLSQALRCHLRILHPGSPRSNSSSDRSRGPVPPDRQNHLRPSPVLPLNSASKHISQGHGKLFPPSFTTR